MPVHESVLAVRVRLAFRVVSILDVASYYFRPLTGAYVWAVNWSEDMAARCER